MSTLGQRTEYQRRYRLKNIEKRRKWNREWIKANRNRYNKAKAEYRFRLKVAAISHYSNGSMACTHCGIAYDLDALCLDHINDDGAQHRKQLGIGGRGSNSGTTMYERLKAKGWMPNLQVLCFNCNTIKELQRKRGGLTSAQMFEAIKKPNHWKDDGENTSAEQLAA